MICKPIIHMQKSIYSYHSFSTPSNSQSEKMQKGIQRKLVLKKMLWGSRNTVDRKFGWKLWSCMVKTFCPVPMQKCLYPNKNYFKPIPKWYPCHFQFLNFIANIQSKQINLAKKAISNLQPYNPLKNFHNFPGLLFSTQAKICCACQL